MPKAVSPTKPQKKKYDLFPYEILICIGEGEKPAQVRDTTLALCKAYRIPAEKISICLAEKGQETEFRMHLLPGSFGKMFAGFSAVPEIFQSGTMLVYMDSCITGFWEFSENTAKKKQPLKSLHGLFQYAFSECQKTGAHLWGIQQMKETTQLRNSVDTHLKKISRALYGCIFSGLDAENAATHEIERTIVYYKLTDTVLTLNMFGASSCHHQSYTKSFIHYLETKYPEFITVERYEKRVKIRVWDKRKHRSKQDEDAI
jgi:hypothetical protein